MSVQAPRRSTWHDAYDAQMGLWRFLRTDIGMRYIQRDYEKNAEGLEGSTQRMLAGMYGNEIDKVMQAEPFFVSAEMVDVVEAASQSFRPEELLPTDLLTGCGFIYFERPFIVKDRFENSTSIAAVSWMPMLSLRDGETAEGIANLQRDDALQILQTRYEVGREDGLANDGIAITIYGLSTTHREMAPVIPWPSVLPYHITPWWFGMSFEGNEVDENGLETGAAWWWRIVQTTFRLMQQRISVRHNERPGRATRREGARQGFVERDVIVVRLRREAGDGHPDDGPHGDANYSHRFIVGGHWRNQWFPSAQVHRQIYISAYVKGPEDKPLLIRPRRVYTWSR